MSEADVRDGKPIFDRIGAACDRLAALRQPVAGLAFGSYARERRGALRRCSADELGGHGRITASHVARDLMEMAEGAERLVQTLEQAGGTPARGQDAHAAIAEASEQQRDTIRRTLELLVGTRGGPPWIERALAYREVGGEVLETAVASRAEPGSTIASSPERHAVVDAHRATLDRLTTPPEDLVDLIAYRITTERGA